MRRIAFLLALLVAPLAGAQNIRGIVRENASNQPVPGAIVIVLDSGRILLTRTLTNARGEYELQRAPQARILRTMRLGFRPVEVPIPASAAETVRLDVNIVAVPVTLEMVRTVAAAACPKRNDSQAALSLLEQARSGLLATVVARSSAPAVLTRLEVIRRRNFDSDNIMSMLVTMDSTESTNSYQAALTAQQFIESGFATDTAGLMTTYGPDAEVLLDEAFANGYCFRIMDAERSRPSQIGLGFQPADHKRGRIEIDGAVWIDTAAKSLVDIEFLYRGFASAFDRGRPGGHIEFRMMPNGVPLIDRWFLRMPSRDSRNDGVPVRGRVVLSERTAGYFIQETGGELARARWKDGTSWRASLGTVRMHLVTEQGRPDTGRVVRLDSTTYAARSDSAGDLVIAELAPGPYKVSALDGRLTQIGLMIPTDANFYAIRDSTLTFSVPTRTIVEYTRDRCRADGLGAGSAMILGRIINPDSTPANKVDITIDKIELGRTSVRVADGGHTGSNGLFHWCGFERDWHVLITAERDELKRVVELPSLEPGVTVIQFTLRREP
jgi:hypothetical protein